MPMHELDHDKMDDAEFIQHIADEDSIQEFKRCMNEIASRLFYISIQYPRDLIDVTHHHANIPYLDVQYINYADLAEDEDEDFTNYHDTEWEACEAMYSGLIHNYDFIRLMLVTAMHPEGIEGLGDLYNDRLVMIAENFITDIDIYPTVFMPKVDPWKRPVCELAQINNGMLQRILDRYVPTILEMYS